MANWQVISLDTTTPQLRAPGTGDGYSFNSGATQLGVWTTTGLGIGTSSPQGPLDVAASGTTVNQFLTGGAGNNAVTGIFKIGSGAGRGASIQGFRGASSNVHSLDFYTYNAADAFGMRLDSTGLGIGTTNPATKLHVAAGNVTIDNAYGYLAADNAGTRESLLSISSGNNVTVATPTLSGSLQYAVRNASGVHQFFTGGTERARIDSSGRLLVGGTTAFGSASGSVDVMNTSGDLLNAARFVANATEARLRFYKSRGATVGTNTIVSSGDSLGSVYFHGANGTGYDPAGYISCEVDGTPGASADMPGRLTFWTSADGSATPTERMRISNAGNVGIGTTSPTTRLEVNNGINNTDGTVTLRAVCGTAGLDPAGFFGTTGAHPLILRTNATERLRTDSSGNVVVNTAAVATTATDGFLYIPGCAGTPTGTPTAYTGRVPLVVDTTNNKLYFYSGGAWRDAGP